MSFLNQVETLLGIGPSRSFGSTNQIFSGYVTLTENTIDEIEITQQPVQQGANIADHAFKKPVNLSIQINFAAGSLIGNLLSGGSSSLPAIYQNLLNLQNTFTPFVVTTPKRTYNNMMFKALGVTTDKTKENILAINASFQEVIIVPLSVGTLSPAQLKNAGSNAGIQQVGQKQSFLYGITGAAASVFKGSSVGGL